MTVDNQQTHLPSGNYRGFYLENHRPEKGWMHLYLDFNHSHIKGEGVDYVGPWHCVGYVDYLANSVKWEKKYVGKHSVNYEGKIDRGRIIGRWNIGQWLSGPFVIWHELDSESAAEFELT